MPHGWSRTSQLAGFFLGLWARAAVLNDRGRMLLPAVLALAVELQGSGRAEKKASAKSRSKPLLGRRGGCAVWATQLLCAWRTFSLSRCWNWEDRAACERVCVRVHAWVESWNGERCLALAHPGEIIARALFLCVSKKVPVRLGKIKLVLHLVVVKAGKWNRCHGR